MSADNGIYILETSGPEYRVSHMMAIDNLNWDDEKKDFSNDPDVMIENAREMFVRAPVFFDKEEAERFAFQEAEDYPFLEYGISSIKINRKFQKIIIFVIIVGKILTI